MHPHDSCPLLYKPCITPSSWVLAEPVNMELSLLWSCGLWFNQRRWSHWAWFDQVGHFWSQTLAVEVACVGGKWLRTAGGLLELKVVPVNRQQENGSTSTTNGILPKIIWIWKRTMSSRKEGYSDDTLLSASWDPEWRVQFSHVWISDL